MATKISFILKRGISQAQRDRLLDLIQHHTTCHFARFSSVPTESKSSLGGRLGYVEAESVDEAERLCAFVRSQPEVEAADIEATRKI